MAAKVLALQVDHVVSPTTPREGLMIKPIGRWFKLCVTFLKS